MYQQFEAAMAHALGTTWIRSSRAGRDASIDFATLDGATLIELKLSRRGPPREVASAATRLARVCRHRGAQRAVLVWWCQTLPLAATQRTWAELISVLAPDVADRLQLVMASPKSELIVPDDESGRSITRALRIAATAIAPSAAHARPDRSYDVLKILLLRWLRGEPAISMHELQAQSGQSHPTVALRLDELGSYVRRTSNRSVELSEFPTSAWTELLALSPRIRQTAGFVDRSGRSGDLVSMLGRLRRQQPPHVAVGGVVGARHWQADFDLDGVPRLDLELHAPDGVADMGFISRLDPALTRADGGSAPIVAVHLVTRASSQYTDDPEHRLPWADPVEILLDLHQLRLTKQADAFVRHWRMG